MGVDNLVCDSVRWFGLCGMASMGSNCGAALVLKNLVDAEAVHYTHFSQDPVNVVFHRLLGYIEVVCDFLIAQTAADQGDQLLFAPRESPFGALLAIWQLSGLRRDIVKEKFRVMRRAHGVTFRHRADRRYHICGRGILQDVTPRATTYRRQEAAAIIRHGDEYALDRPLMFASRGIRGEAIKQKVQ